jgi:ankyrin repeat protein
MSCFGALCGICKRQESDENLDTDDKTKNVSHAKVHEENEKLKAEVERLQKLLIINKNKIVETPRKDLVPTNHVYNFSNETKLMEASKRNDFYTVEQMSTNVNWKDENGLTALHWAAKYSCVEVVQKLIQFALLSVNELDNFKRTALHYATEIGNIEVIQELLKHPKTDLNILDADGQSPLLIAVTLGKLSVTEILLKQPKIQVNIRERGGETSLHLAVRLENENMVKLLLTVKGINLNVNAKCNGYLTALDYAEAQHNKSMCQLLSKGDSKSKAAKRKGDFKSKAAKRQDYAKSKAAKRQDYDTDDQYMEESFWEM